MNLSCHASGHLLNPSWTLSGHFLITCQATCQATCLVTFWPLVWSPVWSLVWPRTHRGTARTTRHDTDHDATPAHDRLGFVWVTRWDSARDTHLCAFAGCCPVRHERHDTTRNTSARFEDARVTCLTTFLSPVCLEPEKHHKRGKCLPGRPDEISQ